MCNFEPERKNMAETEFRNEYLCQVETDLKPTRLGKRSSTGSGRISPDNDRHNRAAGEKL